MKIPLRRRDGSVRAWAVVDAEDYVRVARWRWSLHEGYAVRLTYPGKRRVWLHREILGLARDDPRLGDHRNRDTLDNRRQNLRIAQGHAENRQNLASYRGSRSRHRGVTWHKGQRKWVARIQVRGRLMHLGSFDDEDEAARVAATARRELMPFAVEDLPEQVGAPRRDGRGRPQPRAAYLAIRLAAGSTSLMQKEIADMLGVSAAVVQHTLAKTR